MKKRPGTPKTEESLNFKYFARMWRQFALCVFCKTFQSLAPSVFFLQLRTNLMCVAINSAEAPSFLRCDEMSSLVVAELLTIVGRRFRGNLDARSRCRRRHSSSTFIFYQFIACETSALGKMTVVCVGAAALICSSVCGNCLCI